MENISPALLNWFYANHRILPFRSDPTPYHVWLSEIMLQQTRVSAALPYYERFLAALPDIPALAACEEEKLHKLWEGLGYYSRVRNLQKAAKIVCEQYGGELPADYDALRALPGIGDYTAGAIASISFGLPVPAVDGNVLRVFSRLYNDDGLITDPKVKRAFTARVMEHQPPAAPGDYNQALMELGALVCVPNGAPLCEQCPLAHLCQARAAGTTLSLPRKAAPKARRIEPVEEVVDDMVATLRTNHIRRLRDGQCTVYAGLVFLDILINAERIADQCSNLGVYTISQFDPSVMNSHHEYIHRLHQGNDPVFNREYQEKHEKYFGMLSAIND